MSDFTERSINDYYQSIKKAVQSENGTELCRLLSIDLAHRPTYIRFILQHELNRDPIGDVEWSLLVDLHIKTVKCIREGKFLEAFNEKLAFNDEFCKVLTAQKETNWWVTFMNKHTVDLRKLAIKADAEADIQRTTELARFKGGDEAGKSNIKLMMKDENLERACDHLMRLFRICATIPRSDIAKSKRLGMVCVINQLFKIYFRINKLPLCNPLIRAFESANVFEHCSLAQKVTYSYYLGVKTLFDLKIQEAERLLDFVFANCYQGSRKNIRLTLTFLIPIKMLLGRMPSQRLLEKYDLLQFLDIKKALVSGNISKLDKAIEAHEDFLWRYGIYLIIERLRPIALRNLFKKVKICADSHQIDLDLILKAVRLMRPDEDVQMEEVHCMLANLIYEGKIKGYLSISHQKLVLSKTNAFPSITELVR